MITLPGTSFVNRSVAPVAATGAAHSIQNLAPGGSSLRHSVHRMVVVLSTCFAVVDTAGIIACESEVFMMCESCFVRPAAHGALCTACAIDYIKLGWDIPSVKLRTVKNDPPKPRMTYGVAKGKMCSIEGCDRPVYAKNWCRNHYARKDKPVIQKEPKISASDVVEIQRSEESLTVIARRYDVSESYISLIKRDKRRRT
jgi:hypothetical protein